MPCQSQDTDRRQLGRSLHQMIISMSFLSFHCIINGDVGRDPKNTSRHFILHLSPMQSGYIFKFNVFLLREILARVKGA